MKCSNALAVKTNINIFLKVLGHNSISFLLLFKYLNIFKHFKLNTPFLNKIKLKSKLKFKITQTNAFLKGKKNGIFILLQLFKKT